MELESTSKAGALKRVSGVQMVKDVKKVLQDVESTLEARVRSAIVNKQPPCLFLSRDCPRLCHSAGIVPRPMDDAFHPYASSSHFLGIGSLMSAFNMRAEPLIFTSQPFVSMRSRISAEGPSSRIHWRRTIAEALTPPLPPGQAARKKSGGEHRRPESADVKRNLNDVDHIMDGLEALVHRSSSGGGESSDNSKVSPKAVTDSLADSKKRSSRGRLAAAKALLSLPGGASKTKKKVKLDGEPQQMTRKKKL